MDNLRDELELEVVAVAICRYTVQALQPAPQHPTEA